MRKFLFLGTRVAPYHGSAGIDEQLKRLLAPDWEMTYAENLSLFTDEGLAPFDMVISYLEFDRDRVITDEQTQAITRFVESGHSLLVFHNGISLQVRPELKDLIGARFVGHPYYEAMPVLPYRAVKEHPITDGISSFVSPDEPYRFEMTEASEKEIFLVYDYEDQEWPAGWYRNVGKGKVVYFANGHCRCAFFTEFSKLIVNAVRWANQA